MTKLPFCLATAALALTGCIPDSGETLSTHESESDIPTVPAGIESAGVLGQGRNVVTEELRGDCVRSATTINIPLQEASLRFDSSLLKEEASEMLGFSMDAKARYKLVSGSARAKFSRSLTNNSLSVGMFYVADYRMGIERLDQGNLQWLVQPGAADWLNRCGDHFLHQRERGGQLYLLYRIDFSSTAARQDFEGSVGVSFPAGEVNASITRQSSRFVNRASVHVEAFQVGGDVTRLSSILGGGGADANAGRVIIECSMTNLAPCGTFMQNAINYASSQAAGSFSDSLRASPADRTYLFKDWSLLGVSIPVRAVPTAVKSARFALRELFDGQVEFADRVAVLKGGTLYVPPALQSQLTGYASAVQRNLAILTDAAARCYDGLVDPADAGQVAACTSGVTLSTLTSVGYDASLTMDKLVVDLRQPFAFGGMYQLTSTGAQHDVVNPFTGTTSCPPGFTAQLYGQSLAASQIPVLSRVKHHVCFGPRAGGGWDFTGAFQDNGTGGAFVPNSYAGSAGADCPAGTGTPQMHGWGWTAGLGALSNHRFCTTGTRTPGSMTIGGLFQRATSCAASYPNALTGTTSCPEGFSEVPIANVEGIKGDTHCSATQFVCKPRF